MTQPHTQYQVAGLGNALVDALVRMDDRALLAARNIHRGRMTPVSHTTWQEVFQEVQQHGVEIQSGGSCANTIATLGFLGARSVYCGQVGDDQLGHLYASRMKEACGEHALLWSRRHHTGKCLSIIDTQDAERTMLTDLGAAVAMDGLGNFADVLQHADLFHSEGYQLLGPDTTERLREAIAVANQMEIPVSIDASDPFVIASARDTFWELLEEFVDIVFLNAEEAELLCGCPPETALTRVGEVVETVVVKLGAQGSLVSHKGVVCRVPARPVQAIDTTGAGDAYAGGFLYGYVNGWEPARSADLGARVAALTVSQMGAVVRNRTLLGQTIAAARL
jgi:sugar/nucleoside kinase (ribokinase family)